jgi:hypothetical protein
MDDAAPRDPKALALALVLVLVLASVQALLAD